MKSYAQCLHRVFSGIIKDILRDFPCLHKELIKDSFRIASLVETRGISTYTVDLPALGKHFDKCLSSGTYTHPLLPLAGCRKGTSIPRLFGGLMLRVFQPSGILRDDPDVKAIKSLRQLYAFAKKIRLDCKKERIDDAVSDFFEIESYLPEPTLSWDRCSLDTVENTCRDLSFDNFGSGRMFYRLLAGELADRCGRDRWKQFQLSVRRVTRTLQSVSDLVSSTIGVFDPYNSFPKHGPGAVSDLKGSEYKYSFPNWSDNLEVFFPQSFFAFANESLWVDDGGLPTAKPVSRLISVPKTQKGPRLIAAEPTAHQWCQQAIWHFLEQRVNETWLSNCISFRDQSNNQHFVEKASKTGSHWSVDLSSASDRVTCRFVERLFRRSPTLLTALISVRTPYIRQDIWRGGPSLHKLRKFTTQGSACTFPVETIGFLTVGLTSICLARGINPTLASLRSVSKDLTVFGDDIVIPSDCGDWLLALLEFCQFKVNHSKTHRNGKFRESCGMEVYDGVDVTPAYILGPVDTHKPQSVISWVDSANNFQRRGWYCTFLEMRSMDPVASKQSVPADCGLFGYHCSLSFEPSRVRWNDKLHRREAYLLRPVGRVSKARTEGNPVYLQYFTEDPAPHMPWESGVNGRPRIKLRRGWEDISILA